MRNIIINFPNQISRGIASAQGIAPERPFRRIISCGMGGSQVAAEMLSLVRDNVMIHWDYDLPVNIDNADLVICTSWSGNTEETISSYNKAFEQKLNIIVITQGGELAKIAKDNGTPLVLLPEDHIPPRLGTGYMAGALFAVLGFTDHLPENLNPSLTEARGQELANEIASGIPIIYSSYPWRRLTGFWKMAFNENSKTPAYTNWFPSAAHYDLASMQGNKREMLHPIIIRDTKEDPRHAKNLDALLAILKKMEYNVSIVNLLEGKPLEKVFNNYLLAIWTSYYIAQKNGIDPVDTSFVEEFKKLKRG